MIHRILKVMLTTLSLHIVIILVGVRGFQQHFGVMTHSYSYKSKDCSKVALGCNLQGNTRSTALNAGYGRWSPGSLIVRKRRPDYMAALSYVGATLTQFSFVLVFLHVLQIGVLKRLCVPSFWISGFPDRLISHVPSPADLQTFVVFMVMLFSSVRSRVFSPLDNSRPKASTSASCGRALNSTTAQGHTSSMVERAKCQSLVQYTDTTYLFIHYCEANRGFTANNFSLSFIGFNRK